ncbi:MAG: hypothetical protein PVG03_17875 [Desulfarculaceae bacterium]|jgi:predicted nucleic acid-binding Zn ribbon protein
MPAYEYTCICCRSSEVRIAAIGDRTLICPKCGCPMERPNNTASLLASYKQAASSQVQT